MAEQTPHTGHSQRKMLPQIWIRTSGTDRKQTLWEKQKHTLNNIKKPIMRNLWEWCQVSLLHLWWCNRRTVAPDHWSSCPAVRLGLYSKSGPRLHWCCKSTQPATSAYSHKWTGSLSGHWRQRNHQTSLQILKSLTTMVLAFGIHFHSLTLLSLKYNFCVCTLALSGSHSALINSKRDGKGELNIFRG